MSLPFSSLEVLLPLGYLTFSVWAAYSSGYNMTLMKKHKPRGAGKYGPYLGIVAAFVGIAAMIFIELDELAYDTGFLKLNLPSALSNLNFFTFLLRQFSYFHLSLTRYSEYVILGIILAVVVSYVITKISFDYGKSRIEKD